MVLKLRTIFFAGGGHLIRQHDLPAKSQKSKFGEHGHLSDPAGDACCSITPWPAASCRSHARIRQWSTFGAAI
jgi:hypothetical protein